jgi:hypothetical protein
MLDITYELAALRVLFRDLIEAFPEPDDKAYTANLNRATAMITATGSLVDKISRIQSRNNITAAQVMYLRVSMADILVKYLPDLKIRELAIADLMARIPGGEGDTETRLIEM